MKKKSGVIGTQWLVFKMRRQEDDSFQSIRHLLILGYVINCWIAQSL